MYRLSYEIFNFTAVSHTQQQQQHKQQKKGDRYVLLSHERMKHSQNHTQRSELRILLLKIDKEWDANLQSQRGIKGRIPRKNQNLVKNIVTVIPRVKNMVKR